MKRVLSAAAGLVMALSSAFAQPATPPVRPSDLTPPQATQAPPPPYQAKLERLAELMGTLAFLRDLCGAPDAAAWRGKMNDLMASEGTSAERRDRLAGAFNRGFDGYRLTYRRCTPSASLVIDRALAEGSSIASELSSRFGG